jgi:hypothetical protein
MTRNQPCIFLRWFLYQFLDRFLDIAVLNRRLRLYSFVYPLILKIGLIELEGGPMTQRLVRFLDWAYENWFFSAPVIAFAAICFSPTTPRGILKHLRSSDRCLALKGLRNSAWDLTYVTEWLERLKSQDRCKCLYVLCSCDKTLRTVARCLLSHTETSEESIEPHLRDLLGGSVYEHYTRLIACSENQARATKSPETNLEEHKTGLVAGLEF